MTEEFLHYIWKHKNFDLSDLTSTDGEKIEIIRPGDRNSDAGPDFFNARIRIGNTVWAGNIEIHIRASDWKRHLHQDDLAYDNIILHVVHEADQRIRDRKGKAFPTLELTGRINADLYRKYISFKDSTSWVPCGKQASSASPIVIESWLERLLVERLEKKAGRILHSLELNHNNWEESFYHQLARNFGFRLNAVPFEMLGRSTPFNLFSHYRDNLVQTEALLFGQAGLLEEYFFEPYAQHLQSEYQFLAKKHSLDPMKAELWKFLRLRPLNFPTVRIAQFAKLLHDREHLFSKILEKKNIDELKSLFMTGVSEFWEVHYQLGSYSPSGPKFLGDDSVENILINTVAPFLFVYGKQRGQEHATDFAMEILSETRGENNNIIRNWKTIGLEVPDGGRSQALLELKESYCNAKRCLDCGIGRFLLRRELVKERW
jgi:hypothetical protein